MNTDNAQQRLQDAETRLARALQRLHALRRAALSGGYDPIEFDQALMAYRRAEKEALAAREEWSRSHQLEPEGTSLRGFLAGVQPPQEPAEPFSPTNRMRFVKWLVENGRLSDWDASQQAKAA